MDLRLLAKAIILLWVVSISLMVLSLWIDRCLEKRQQREHYQRIADSMRVGGDVANLTVYKHQKTRGLK